MTANNKTRQAVIIGSVLVLLGVVLNKWVVAKLISPDDLITSPVDIGIILAIQSVLIAVGVYLLLRRPQREYTNYILLAMSLLATIALFEVGTRFWLRYIADEHTVNLYTLPSEVEPSKFRWTPHHYLDFYPTPNYRKAGTAHNSLGFRGREILFPKPAGVFRIAVLGGSTTYSDAVSNNDQTFPSQLESILRNEYHHDEIEVVNAGVSGYNSWESLINLEFRVLDTEPDLVIVYHGTNDVHARLVVPGSYRGDDSGRRKRWSAPRVPLLIRYSRLMRVLDEKLELSIYQRPSLGAYVNASTYRGAGTQYLGPETEKLLDQNPPIYFKRNLINIIAVARAHNARTMLATFAYSPTKGHYTSNRAYQRGLEENNAVIARVAAERGVALFDLAKVMPKDKKYWADGVHVNASGARLKAQLFAGYIAHSDLLDRGRQ